MIKVVVADDQALVRGGFRVLVDSAPDLAVVGEVSDGAEAVEVSRAERPHVILMDIRMPRMDGLEATRLICGSADTEAVRVLIPRDRTQLVVIAYETGLVTPGNPG